MNPRLLRGLYQVLEPSTAPPLGVDAAKRLLTERGPDTWYNRIEIVEGVSTSPFRVDFDGEAFFRFLGIAPENLVGVRVLDIGAFDGAVSFFAERCGAEVVAIDVQDPKSNGFSVIHEIRASTVTHVMCSVYDLHPDLFGRFDIVVCSGVHYHLRHPLLAFERINEVTDSGARFLIVGTVANHLPPERGQQDDGDDFARLDVQQLPLCRFYRDKYIGDRSNWFIPTTACLESMLASCGFDTEQSSTSRLAHLGAEIEAVSLRTVKNRAPDTEFDDQVYADLRVLDKGADTVAQNRIPTHYEATRARSP